MPAKNTLNKLSDTSIKKSAPQQKAMRPSWPNP
jgi:hypothetical protein